ncbi:MAG: 4Fe-4S binding protein [Acidiferrobacteraceae bacterium]
MRRHTGVIAGIQWATVLFYLVLLALPFLWSLSFGNVHVHDEMDWWVRFVFWGLWWPLVIISMMMMGRVWCGVLCPEGTLTEAVSRYGLGRGIPPWMKWRGWPFVIFALTAVYGELINVHAHAEATALLLGGSTVLAVWVGFLYGRGKRVWCRYLCPINGVFIALARLSPLHFRVDEEAWVSAPRGIRSSRRTPVNCAPLIDIRRMTGASQCHVCGRCSGQRNAVRLAARSPNREVLSLTATEIPRWEGVMLVYGLLGFAAGVFQWSVSPWFVSMKGRMAGWLTTHGWLLLFKTVPWWLLMHYSLASGGFTWFDGLSIVLYIGGTALVLGGWVTLWLWLAEKSLVRPGEMWRLAYSLAPLAGIGIVLGSGTLTLTLLGDQTAGGLRWVSLARGGLLAAGVLWSIWLAVRMIVAEEQVVRWRKLLAVGAVVAGGSAVVFSWVLMFYLW